MGQRLLLAFAAILGLLSPSLAFEVQEGECQRILSGQARVRIHYTSGLKVEVDPPSPDNITAQVDIFPDGRRVSQKWLAGGGVLPLENPQVRFTYAEPTDVRFELGETRRFSYTLKRADGSASSGTMVLAIERVEKAAFGECQATFVEITTAAADAQGRRYSLIRRLFVREIGFFTTSTIEVVREGKSMPVTFEATRIELIR